MADDLHDEIDELARDIELAIQKGEERLQKHSNSSQDPGSTQDMDAQELFS